MCADIAHGGRERQAGAIHPPTGEWHRAPREHLMQMVEETNAWSDGCLPRRSKRQIRRKPLTYSSRASTLLDLIISEMKTTFFVKML